MTVEPFPRAVIDSIVSGSWASLPDAARDWTESAPADPVARLSLIIGLLLNWRYGEAYEQHEALVSALDGKAENAERLTQAVEQIVTEHPKESGPRLFFGL